MIYKSYFIEKQINNMNEKLFLFFGENLGLQNDFKKMIKKCNKDSEIINIYQDEILQNKNLLLNEISNISLFEKKKIFFINQSNDKICQLMEEISHLVTDQKIYIFSEILEKKSKLRNFFEKSKNCAAVACYQDNELSIKKIITQELHGYDGLNAFNINLIADNVNLDRSRLKNELGKIKTFFINKKIQTEELIILLNIKISENFNELKNHALLGNKEKTNNLLSETIFETDKIIFYLSILNQSLSRLHEVKNTESENIAAKVDSLKPPIFWKDKPNFILQCKKWSRDKIKKIQTDAYNLELQIKSNSVIEKDLLMKKFIVDICQLANS